MNTEFIVSTIIGVVGIALTFVSMGLFRKNKPKALMKKLLDKELDDIERQKILKKINKSIGGLISMEYIENFKLNKRKIEEVFGDICISNHIEPTESFCIQMIGYDSKKARDTYNSKGIYVSELLQYRYPEAYANLKAILDKHNIPIKQIKGTKDIWCRDYMPVKNTSGKLIQFRYEPSYLKGRPEWEASRSDVKKVCEENGLKPIFSDINLDGGNVLLKDGRAIISDRIYNENPERTDKDALVKELENLLEAEVIIIPSQNMDMTGHADGMVRFIDKNTILGNNLNEELKYWRDGMQKILAQYNLQYKDVPFFEYRDPTHKDNAIGIYVNYLEVGNLIILPIFGVPGNKDEEAKAAFHQIFPDRIIETINYNQVALDGGVLNCSTWTVLG